MGGVVTVASVPTSQIVTPKYVACGATRTTGLIATFLPSALSVKNSPMRSVPSLDGIGNLAISAPESLLQTCKNGSSSAVAKHDPSWLNTKGSPLPALTQC